MMEWHTLQAREISEVLSVLAPLVKFPSNGKASACLWSQCWASLPCPLPPPTLLCSDIDSSIAFPVNLKTENNEEYSSGGNVR